MAKSVRSGVGKSIDRSVTGITKKVPNFGSALETAIENTDTVVPHRLI